MTTTDGTETSVVPETQQPELIIVPETPQSETATEAEPLRMTDSQTSSTTSQVADSTPQPQPAGATADPKQQVGPQNTIPLAQTPTPASPSRLVTKLQSDLNNKDSELERMNEKVLTLTKDMKLMKLHLSQKEDEIKEYERNETTGRCEEDRLKRELAKTKKQTNTLQHNSFVAKTNHSNLDSENLGLREENRQLKAQCASLDDQLAIMTATCHSLQCLEDTPPFKGAATASMSPPAAAASLWQAAAPVYHNVRPNKPPPRFATPPQMNPHRTQDVRPKALPQRAPLLPTPTAPPNMNYPTTQDVRPKVFMNRAPLLPTPTGPPQPANPAHPSAWSKGPPTFNRPTQPQNGTGQPAKKKASISVIGASNTRNLSKHLQSKDVDSLVWVNPGCRMQDLENRAQHMVTRDTDLAVIHLGTNNALGNETDNDCLVSCSDAMDKMEQTTGDTPLLVCSVPPTHMKHGQRRVNMLNCLLKDKCSRSHKLQYVNTGLLSTDIGRDGIHLTDSGKKKLASSMQQAIQGFLITQHHMNT